MKSPPSFPILAKPKYKVRDKHGDIFYLGTPDPIGGAIAIFADRPNSFTYRTLGKCEVLEDYTDEKASAK